MAEKNTIFCKEEHCNVAQDGKCVNGLELKDCPHYQSNSISEEIQDAQENLTEKPNENSLINLYSGNEMTCEEAREITSSSLSKLIVILGAPESGKTTLLTCLNELFQKGIFSNYMFAGSKTLIGFEKRSYRSRFISGAKAPDTERTKFESTIKLLHLAVRDIDCKKPIQNMFFTDMAGEYFDFFRDSTEECQKCKILKRADHFVLLIDCENLLDPSRRNITKVENVALLRSCVGSGMLGPKSIVDIVFSKWDLVHNLEEKHKEKISNFINLIKNNVENAIKSEIGDLNFFNVAARPITSLESGYGMNEVFPHWVTKSLLYREKQYVIDHQNMQREFSNYSWKHYL